MASHPTTTHPPSDRLTICLVGNPNCGKTTLFNELTGSRQSVGNWPGVTVEQKVGHFQCGARRITLVDLPGTYSIDVIDESLSIDEKITRDYLITQRPDLVINIVDASNLERNLYLTTEVLDTGIPMIVALNMVDVLRHRKIELDLPAIEKALDCPVVPIVASKGMGVDQLKAQLLVLLERPVHTRRRISYPAPIEQAIALLQPSLTALCARTRIDTRWLAVRLLEEDSLAQRLTPDTVLESLPEIKASMQSHLTEELGVIVADTRYDFIHKLVGVAVNRRNILSKHRTDLIDQWVLHRWLGLPIFFLVMYGLFFVTAAGSQFFIDFFDRVSAALVVDGLSSLLTHFGLNELTVFALANGIGGGIQVVATFIPVVTFLFLGLSLLEGTGYMARGAFVLDRSMRQIGLPGKAFVPLLMGFGCSVPAVLATRTLKHSRDRLLTMFLVPFMSCGAKLPVYALFAAAFFPDYAASLIFGLYLLGIAIAVLTGLIIKKKLLPGESSPFFIELPTYHIPTLRNVVIHTWHRLSSFIWGAGKIIVPMVLVLNMLNSITLDGKLDLEGVSENSVLSFVGKQITPLLSGFGITQDNWPASVGIFTGLLAKEATVGTLETLYSRIDSARANSLSAGDGRAAYTARELDETSKPITPNDPETINDPGSIDEPADGLHPVLAEIRDATVDLLTALPGIGNLLFDPLGVGNSLAEAQEAGDDSHSAMRAHFKGASGALAYLLFMLLYSPCAAALGAISRESNGRWTLFVILWSTGIAYATATLFYQAAHFSAHPLRAISWFAAIGLLFIATWAGLGWYGRRHTPTISNG